MKKKMLPLFLAVVMAAGLLASCGAVSQRDSAKETPAEVGYKSFTAYGLNDGQWNRSNNMDDPVGKAITEATGVKLIGDNPIGPWQEPFSLLLASGDLPDLVGHTGQSRQMMYEAGAMKPLKDLIMKAPNIVAFYGDEIGRLAFSAEDREFYSFGTGRRDSEATPDSHWEFAYFVQLPVLEAAGYPKLKTPYEFEEIIADYLAANPTVDGRTMYGMSFWIGDNWRHSFLNAITNTSGLPSDTEWYVNPTTYEVTSVFRHPGAKQYIGWLNHLNDVGLLDPETITQSRDMLIEKISNGQEAGLMHAKWVTWEAAEYLPENNPAYDTLGFPLRWDPDNTQWRDLQGRGILEGMGYSVTTAVNDADTQLLVNFFDYLCSDEGQKLQSWGIEGEHYTFDQNDTSKDWKSSKTLYVGNDPRGPRRLAPEVWDLRYNPNAERVDIRNQTGLDKFGNQLIAGGVFALKDGYILNDYARDADEYFGGRTPELQTALKAYGIKSEKELFPPGMPTTIGLPNIPYGARHTLAAGSTSDAHMVALNQYLEAIPVELSKLIVVPAAQFDAEWDNFIKFLENQVNIKILEEEHTKLLKDRMAMWYD